jgi:Ca-activated chloride channel family protein
MAAGFRRGLLFSLPVLLLPALFLAEPARAGIWDDLWQTRDQQAQAALARQEADRAAALAKSPGIAGEAWFRADDYERANEAWSGLQTPDAHYNRGNALAHQGDLEGAIAAYDAALAMNPDMEDAQYNRALVEQMLEQQQQQQQEQESSENQEGESSEQQNQEGEQQDQDSQGEEGESEPQEGEGDPSERSEQEMEADWTEEDAQAMEQWLRRIPDDPGGLLRRKFRSQHQKRGAPADEEKTW